MTDEEMEKSYRSGLPGVLGVIDTAISKMEAVILAMGVLLMALNTVTNVIARFVFGNSIMFSGELNRILIIMITFAGIGYAARHGRHIRMSAIYDALPVGGRKVLMIGIALFTSLVMFFLLYYSSLGLPVWIIYLWVPMGFLITGIQYLLTAVKNFTSHDVYLSTGVVDGYKDTETEV